uniref:Alpha-taxilin n=1 Tax=Plectus sambesii TaxID=2011161 RepID=A0A914VJW2_9BILA
MTSAEIVPSVEGAEEGNLSKPADAAAKMVIEDEKCVPQDPASSSVSQKDCKDAQASSKCKSHRPVLAKQGSGDSSPGSSVEADDSPTFGGRTAVEEKLLMRGFATAAELKKSLSQYNTADAKVDALVASQTLLLEEKRLMQKTLKDQQKMFNAMTKKLERKEQDHQKTLLAKTKLETLCRELQKFNREIKEENLERLKKHEASRQEMVEQFRRSLGEIQQSMDSGKDRSERLAEDNQELSTKLKGLAEQYENREDHAKQLVAAKDIEVKLYDAKMQSAQLQLQKVTEEKLRAEHALLVKLQERDVQVKEALASEMAMRDQITKYSAKYDELHKSLASSNETFDRFKREIEKMNANMIKVERESRKWRSKFDEANKMLAGLVSEKKNMDELLAQKDRQLENLQKLCRTLQEQRVSLLQQLKQSAPEGDKSLESSAQSLESSPKSLETNANNTAEDLVH